MIPENCPSCGSKLVTVKDQLYCKNSSGCPAQNAKGVEHFCKTMKVKGLGPKRIEALGLTSIEEIYALSHPIIAEKLGAKTADNIMAEIEKARHPEFGVFLASLGIPLIGQAAANKVAALTNDLDGITTDLCKQAGLGDKATSNLVSEVKNYSPLPVTFDTISIVEKLEGIPVCISGKLTGFTKAQATTLLEEAGFTVLANLTAKVKILITEQEGTAKYKQAKNAGLPIGTLQEVLDGSLTPIGDN